jgi:sec-independent protein translocase protein TatA
MTAGFLSPVHVLVVVAVVLMVFGPKRLPELGKSIGTGLRGFKDSLESRPEDEPKQLD